MISLCIVFLFCWTSVTGAVTVHNIATMIGSSLLIPGPGVKINEYTYVELKKPGGKPDWLAFRHGPPEVSIHYTKRGEYFLNGSFLLNNLTADDSGEYWQEVNYTLLAKINIKVLAPVEEPILQMHNWLDKQCAVTLKCNGSGEGTLNMTLLKDGNKIAATREGSVIESSVSSLVPESQGTYTCIVANPVSEKTSRSVKIQYPVHTSTLLSIYLSFFSLEQGIILLLPHLCILCKRSLTEGDCTEKALSWCLGIIQNVSGLGAIVSNWYFLAIPWFQAYAVLLMILLLIKFMIFLLVKCKTNRNPRGNGNLDTHRGTELATLNSSQDSTEQLEMQTASQLEQQEDTGSQYAVQVSHCLESSVTRIDIFASAAIVFGSIAQLCLFFNKYNNPCVKTIVFEDWPLYLILALPLVIWVFLSFWTFYIRITNRTRNYFFVDFSEQKPLETTELNLEGHEKIPLPGPAVCPVADNYEQVPDSTDLRGVREVCADQSRGYVSAEDSEANNVNKETPEDIPLALNPSAGATICSVDEDCEILAPDITDLRGVGETCADELGRKVSAEDPEQNKETQENSLPVVSSSDISPRVDDCVIKLMSDTKHDTVTTG